MSSGTSQGLFVIVAVVIFGIFVGISYILFQDLLKPKLTSIFQEGFFNALNYLTPLETDIVLINEGNETPIYLSLELLSDDSYLIVGSGLTEDTIWEGSDEMTGALTIPDEILGKPITEIGKRLLDRLNLQVL